MRAQESNAKPQGLPGPFPSFPFVLAKTIPAGEIGMVSTQPINHEFYITQVKFSHSQNAGDRNGIWLAPAGITTPNNLFANGTPLVQNVTPGNVRWSNIFYHLSFLAGPYPKGYALYISYDNTQAEKEEEIIIRGVIAYDIYKDTNYPETRH